MRGRLGWEGREKSICKLDGCGGVKVDGVGDAFGWDVGSFSLRPDVEVVGWGRSGLER